MSDIPNIELYGKFIVFTIFLNLNIGFKNWPVVGSK